MNRSIALSIAVAATVQLGSTSGLAAAGAPIDAVVQAVGKSEDKIVVLSVGRSDKVREGFEFTVLRDDRFVGKVKVIKVYDELCGARILFTKDGETIRQGDKATALLGALAKEKPDETRTRMEKARTAYASPGREHMLLARRAGKWSYRAKLWDAPGASPSESAGKSEFRMILGGLYSLETTEAQGLALVSLFRGMGMAGYDNFKEKYVMAWIDTMGTGIALFEGDASKDEKTIAYASEQPDLLDGKQRMMKIRAIESHKDADHFSFEIRTPGPDGREFKSFEIRYSRER